MSKEPTKDLLQFIQPYSQRGAGAGFVAAGLGVEFISTLQ
jgi:hypothetical protein